MVLQLGQKLGERGHEIKYELNEIQCKLIQRLNTGRGITPVLSTVPMLVQSLWFRGLVKTMFNYSTIHCTGNEHDLNYAYVISVTSLYTNNLKHNSCSNNVYTWNSIHFTMHGIRDGKKCIVHKMSGKFKIKAIVQSLNRSQILRTTVIG